MPNERSRPRVLAITSEPPWPLNSGGHLRTYYLLRAIARRCDLELVCPVQPQGIDLPHRLRANGLVVRDVPVSRRSVLSEAVRLVGATAASEPYVMYRRHRWHQMLRAVEERTAQWKPAVVYLDHLDAACYLPAVSQAVRPNATTVIDLHNVYSRLAQRTADEHRNPIVVRLLRREARLLEMVERKTLMTCSGAFAVSDQEASHYRGIGRATVWTIPNGVDCATYADIDVLPRTEPCVLFVGTLSWAPNAHAVRFLAREVLPKVRQTLPGASLVIVGRDAPPDIASLHGRDGVAVEGQVPDVRPFLAKAAVLAVPLEAGGGTRLKILEAFAAGVPVVSTGVGIEGIRADPDAHFVLAERPLFADALVALLRQPSRGVSLALRARELARAQYDWEAIGARATDAVIASA